MREGRRGREKGRPGSSEGGRGREREGGREGEREGEVEGETEGGGGGGEGDRGLGDLGELVGGHGIVKQTEVGCQRRTRLHPKERMFLERMTSDRKLKASREGSK